MAIPSVDINEDKPAGTRGIKLGDNDIREHKKQIREIMSINHEYPSTGNSDTAGQHTKVTLQEQADLGTGAVGATILGSQTISDKGELVYTNEADTDIVITNQTGINAPSITGVYAAANVAAIATIGALLFPIGSIYGNASNATNPGTLLGFGTWVAIEEEVIAGYKAGGTFDPVGTLSEGAETVDASHNHGGQSGATSFPEGSGQPFGGGTSAHTHAISTDGSETQNIIQPTYVAYLWRRTV